MDAFEAQVDHYKDTCDIQRETVKARNRLFILVWRVYPKICVNLQSSV